MLKVHGVHEVSLLLIFIMFHGNLRSMVCFETLLAMLSSLLRTHTRKEPPTAPTYSRKRLAIEHPSLLTRNNHCLLVCPHTACLPPTNRGLSEVAEAPGSCQQQGVGGWCSVLGRFILPQVWQPNPSPCSKPISHSHHLLPDREANRQDPLTSLCFWSICKSCYVFFAFYFYNLCIHQACVLNPNFWILNSSCLNIFVYYSLSVKTYSLKK